MTETEKKALALVNEEIAYLREALSYDPRTGSLIWRGDRPVHHFKSEGIRQMWLDKHAGKTAGGITSEGYFAFMVGGKKYQSHRVAWAIHYGMWPEGDIDHINHDRVDNRIANLRDVSRNANSKNRSSQTNNTSGQTGVVWNRKERKWQAQIVVNKRIKHLGRFADKDEAIAARKAAEIEHGFHPNHGRAALAARGHEVRKIGEGE